MATRVTGGEILEPPGVFFENDDFVPVDGCIAAWIVAPFRDAAASQWDGESKESLCTSTEVAIIGESPLRDTQPVWWSGCRFRDEVFKAT